MPRFNRAVLTRNENMRIPRVKTALICRTGAPLRPEWGTAHPHSLT